MSGLGAKPLSPKKLSNARTLAKLSVFYTDCYLNIDAINNISYCLVSLIKLKELA
jgi:hypothetical protein